MAQQPSIARLAADVRVGQLANITVTLGAGGSTTTVEVPMWAVGFKLRPGGDIRFALNQNASNATSSSATVTTDDLGVGGISKANTWESRLLHLTHERTLHLLAVTGSEVVEIEFF